MGEDFDYGAEVEELEEIEEEDEGDLAGIQQTHGYDDEDSEVEVLPVESDAAVNAEKRKMEEMG